MSRPSLIFVSVVPSPYQRDVFQTIAQRGRVPLRVYYMESTSPDNPWVPPALESWECILPGHTFRRGVRCAHLNWGLPALRTTDFWVLNGMMSDFTTQLLMRRLGRRFRWAFWGERPSRPNSTVKRYLQYIQYSPLGHARLIAAIGTRAVDDYQRLIPRVPVHNQPYACDLSTFATARQPRLAGQDTVFLFCGQMIVRKGIDLLLTSFSRLVIEDRLPVRLRLIGREAALLSMLATLPTTVRERIDYLGFIEPNALPPHFAATDIFVLPSRYDGWGVVVNQALGAALPTIVSDAVGASNLISSEENGLIIPAGEAAPLYAAMHRLATDPALRSRLTAGAARTSATLSPDRAAEFWETMSAIPQLA